MHGPIYVALCHHWIIHAKIDKPRNIYIRWDRQVVSHYKSVRYSCDNKRSRWNAIRVTVLAMDGTWGFANNSPETCFNRFKLFILVQYFKRRYDPVVRHYFCRLPILDGVLQLSSTYRHFLTSWGYTERNPRPQIETKWPPKFHAVSNIYMWVWLLQLFSKRALYRRDIKSVLYISRNNRWDGSTLSHSVWGHAPFFAIHPVQLALALESGKTSCSIYVQPHPEAPSLHPQSFWWSPACKQDKKQCTPN